MNETSLKVALAEAERFLRAARIAAKALQSPISYAGGKETAACKRASMDLTRALADIRRPG